MHLAHPQLLASLEIHQLLGHLCQIPTTKSNLILVNPFHIVFFLIQLITEFSKITAVQLH